MLEKIYEPPLAAPSDAYVIVTVATTGGGAVSGNPRPFVVIVGQLGEPGRVGNFDQRPAEVQGK